MKGITVTVRAGPRQYPTGKKSYPTAPKAISPGKSSPFGATTNYYYNMPAGTTADKLEQHAEAIYNQIISHAMKLRCRLPADEITGPQSTIVVHGTGTTFDQTYFTKVVTRSMSVEEGFSMEIDAQNNSPNVTPVENIDNSPGVTPVAVTAKKLPEPRMTNRMNEDAADHRPTNDEVMAQTIRELARQGLTVHDTAAAVNLNASAVHRVITGGEFAPTHFTPHQARF